MRIYRKLLASLLGLIAITGLGTVGYRVVEDMPWLDALYQTVITVSTVGFAEVVSLSPAGRIFTIGLIVTGVGIVLYLLSSLAEIVVEGRLRELMGRGAMRKKLDQLTIDLLLGVR